MLQMRKGCGGYSAGRTAGCLQLVNNTTRTVASHLTAAPVFQRTAPRIAVTALYPDETRGCLTASAEHCNSDFVLSIEKVFRERKREKGRKMPAICYIDQPPGPADGDLTPRDRH